MDEELEQLSEQVFKTFARCEYALKATGFHKKKRDAEADWRAFALSIEGCFTEPLTPELTAAVAYLLEHPPKKQVIRDGQLAWEETKPDAKSHADLILWHVRRVRNNLFHGGKFNRDWVDPERSAALMQHSLTILRAAVSASEEVREAYGD